MRKQIIGKFSGLSQVQQQHLRPLHGRLRCQQYA
jgi:hypothetical protein